MTIFCFLAIPTLGWERSTLLKKHEQVLRRHEETKSACPIHMVLIAVITPVQWQCQSPHLPTSTLRVSLAIPPFTPFPLNSWPAVHSSAKAQGWKEGTQKPFWRCILALLPLQNGCWGLTQGQTYLLYLFICLLACLKWNVNCGKDAKQNSQVKAKQELSWQSSTSSKRTVMCFEVLSKLTAGTVWSILLF